MSSSEVSIIFKKAEEIINKNPELKAQMSVIGLSNEKIKELRRIVEDINSAQEEPATITRA